MKRISLLIGITSVLLISCKEELQPQESSKAVHAEQTGSNNTPTLANTAQTATPAQNTTASTPTNTTEAGKNPAHGQPGHRCDLPVGAPLTSQANTQPATKTTSQQMQITPQMIANSVKTKKGMNPPHGRLGHRCDIAVGAPLNSKPQKPTTQSITQPVANNTNIVVPANNPPHGQPGHVCGTPATTTPATTTSAIPATISTGETNTATPVKVEEGK